MLPVDWDSWATAVVTGGDEVAVEVRGASWARKDGNCECEVCDSWLERSSGGCMNGSGIGDSCGCVD